MAFNTAGAAAPGPQLSAVISEYIRKVTPNIFRKRVVPAMLQARKRVSYNHHGTQMEWPVRYRRVPMNRFSMFGTQNFQVQNKHLTAALPWRYYVIAESYTKQQQLMTQGNEAIVKLYEGLVDSLIDDITDAFAEELYVDGNASGSTDRIHGFESALGNSGAAAGGYIGTPSDTYAGLSTVLGNYGGTLSSGTWPHTAIASAQYDFWSPVIVDYTDTAWSATTKTWEYTNIEAMRFGIVNSQRNKTRLDAYVLPGDMYRLFLNTNDPKEQVTVVLNSDRPKIASLGWGETQNFDGIEITWEYGCTANVGYGLAFDEIELRSQQKQLFVAEAKDFDLAGYAHRIAVDFAGNLKLNPRTLVKLVAIT